MLFLAGFADAMNYAYSTLLDQRKGDFPLSIIDEIDHTICVFFTTHLHGQLGSTIFSAREGVVVRYYYKM